MVKNCLKCSSEYKTKPSHAKRSKYCSYKCYWKSILGTKQSKKTIEKRSKALSGENNPFYGKKHSQEMKKYLSSVKQGVSIEEWTGFKSDSNYLERRLFRASLQKKVFERDNYTCQLCSSKGNLQVDHIQSWSEYVEQRFNIDNCRTLCANCHYEITFGKPMPPTVRAWGHNLFKGENKT